MSARKLALFSSAIAACALVLGAWVAGCDGPSVPAYDRVELIREIGEEVIVPGYESVETESAALSDATSALCEAPSADTLSAARDAWRRTFLAWQRTMAFGFGPARDMNLGPEMAFAPTDPSAIEGQIAGTTEITATFVDGLGGTSKGIYALEYLLFAEDGDATVTALTDARRCAYVGALADHVKRTSTRLADAWRPSGGNYVGTLETAGALDNVVYPQELSAISALIDELVMTAEAIKVDKISTPLGRLDIAAMPDALESPYANASVEAMQANLAGVRAVWMSTEHNFDEYVRTRNPDLADAALSQLDAADAAIAALPEPLAEYAAGTDHAARDAAYAALGTLHRTLGTDVGTTLGVMVGAFMNDGD